MAWSDVMTRRKQAMLIIAGVAEEHGVTVEDVLGPRRFAPILAARTRAVQKLRGEMGLSQSAIGRILGKHHSTITHYCNERRRLRSNERAQRRMQERRARERSDAAAAE